MPPPGTQHHMTGEAFDSSGTNKSVAIRRHPEGPRPGEVDHQANLRYTGHHGDTSLRLADRLRAPSIIVITILARWQQAFFASRIAMRCG